MNDDEYKKYRKAGMDLSLKIAEGKIDFMHAGKKLDLVQSGTLAFESDEETDILMDFCIYEKNKRGVKQIDWFYENAETLTDIEEDVLEGMVGNKNSIFEFSSVDKENSIVTITDLLDKNKKTYKLKDLGLVNAPTRIVAYLRIIKISDDIFMTSGVSFPFMPNKKDNLLSDISMARMKARGRFNSEDLFLTSYKCSKKYGLQVRNEEIV